METSVRVVIEFAKSSDPKVGRVIRFNHSPETVPYQLKGRVAASTWENIMSDVDLLAKEHPYVQRPGAKDVGGWALCAAIGSVMGVCCMNPDAGDYGEWINNVHRVIARYQRALEQGGCQMRLEKGINYWLQIDVDPNSEVKIDGPSPRRVKGDSSSFISPFQSLPSDLDRQQSKK